MTEAEQLKQDRENRVAAAWNDLALNPAFNVIFQLDLQVAFPVFAPSFQSADSFNSKAAAQRDGNKEVVCHIWKRLGAAKERITAKEDGNESKRNQQPKLT